MVAAAFLVGIGIGLLLGVAIFEGYLKARGL